jgi:hypothetical protein
MRIYMGSRGRIRSKLVADEARVIVSLADGRWLVMAAKRGRRSVSVAGRGCGSRTI